MELHDKQFKQRYKLKKSTENTMPHVMPRWAHITMWAISVFLGFHAKNFFTFMLVGSLIGLPAYSIFYAVKRNKMAKKDKDTARGFIIILVIAFIVAIIGGTITNPNKDSANAHTDTNAGIITEQKIAPPEMPRFDENLAQDSKFKDGEKATVTRVIDGDTIHAGGHKIRIIGLDAPESKHPRKPVECFSGEATNRMSELVSGKTVYLVADPSQDSVDKYKRKLFYVYLEDGTNVAYQMIKDGYAHEYTYNSNPHRWQKQFRDAQNDARSNKRGLWGDETCAGDKTSVAEKKAQAENERRAAESAAAAERQRQQQVRSQAAPSASAPAPSGIRFRNCKEARAAGYSHMRRGEPGYSENLDKDKDGIACDKHR